MNRARQARFNSIVVRLKGTRGLLGNRVGHRFNSIVVRLKGEGIEEGEATYFCFNSIVVRLKGNPTASRSAGSL